MKLLFEIIGMLVIGLLAIGPLAFSSESGSEINAPVRLIYSDVKYGGSGCPQGSMDPTIDTDGNFMGFLFHEFQLSVGGMSGGTFARKSCNLALPISVAPGYQVAALAFPIQVAFSLSESTRFKLHSEVFVAGQKGPIHEETYAGPMSASFNYFPQWDETDLVWSECGKDTILRMNFSGTLSTDQVDRDASAVISMLGIAQGAGLQVLTRPCP